MSGEVEVKVVKNTRIDTPPGKVLTVGFSVNNGTTVRQRFTPQLFLPAGWRTVLRPTSFEIDAHQSEISLISISIPSQIPVGEYPVRYSVTDESVPPHVADAVLTVAVRGVNRIELVLLESPRFVVAGEKIGVQFSLANKGNAPAVIRLHSRAIAIDSVCFDSAVVRMRPNEIRQLRAVGYTNDSTQIKLQTFIEVTASLISDSTIAASTSASVQIIPSMSNVKSNAFTFPLTTKLRMAGSRGAYGPQIELSGYGPLSDGSPDRFDILVRAPQTITRSFIGERDEYRAAYRAKSFDVYVGDQSFVLSPLTEYGRYAFGGGGRATVGGLSVGGFANNNRFTDQNQNENAGFLSYRFQKEFALGVNFMQKKGADEGSLYSFRTLVDPIPNAALDMEYARSKAGANTGDAYSGKITGKAQWYTYTGWYVHSDPNYTGYFRDLNSAVGSFSIDPWRSVRFEGYFRDERRNLRKDTALFVAPHEKYYHFGVSLASYVSLYYEYTSQVDLLPAPQYNYREHIVELQTGYNFSTIGFLAYADVGQSENLLINNRALSQRYMLSTNVRVFGNQNYSLTLEYAKNQNVFTGDPQKLMSAGFYAAVPIGNRTRLLLNAYTSKSISITTQKFQTLDLTVEHTLPWNHRINFRGRENFYDVTSSRDYAYVAEYVVPFDFPVGRSGRSGELTGRVIDSETGKGVPRAIIFVGDATTITDDDGEYRFPIFTPDKYFVQVEKASIGFERVTTVPMPLEVSIKGGIATRLDLSLVRAALVSGTIMLYGFDTTNTTSTSYIKLRPMYDIVVELTNGSETYRRVSDTQGRFSFTEMRPGHWTLKVLDGQLPDYHNTEKEKYELTLQPRQTADVELKVRPRKRAIRIIEEGQVIEQGKSPKPLVQTPVLPAPQKPQPQIQPQSPSAVEFYPIIWDEGRKGYVIQVSSWRTKLKAQRDRRSVRSMTGMIPFIDQSSVPGLGIRYRVFLGTFATQEKAEAIVKILTERRK